MKPILGLDFETYSEVDLPKCGLYRYMDDPSFEVLLLSWALDDGPVTLIDFTKGESIGPELRAMLESPDYVKCAFNSQFEMNALRTIGIRVDPEQWIDTQIMASYAGLPRTLATVGQALKLPEDKAKMKVGKELITYFCKPCKPTKTNGGRTRSLPCHAPDKWKTFCDYNIRDVETERTVRNRLSKYPVPEREWKLWRIDVGTNTLGVRIDRQMAEAAVDLAQEQNDILMQRAIDLTGLDNPNSVVQLKEWLELEDGQTLGKKDVAEMLKTATGDTKEMLQLRQELSKTSIKKYQAMLRAACHDDRVRGCMEFYKAHTGRWSSTLLQLQNLKQNHLDDLSEARKMVKERDTEGIQFFYGSVSDTLSQLVRTAIIPADGKRFVVADYSAIEARVVAWLANEKWVMDAFKNGEDIYCATASQMFHCKVVKNGENGHLRQRGKIATLANSYGGSVGALIAMGALDMGLPENELPEIVQRWRDANPHIVNLWYSTENAVMEAMNTPGAVLDGPHGITYQVKGAFLRIHLPAGRDLYYLRPKMTTNRFGNPSVSYEGNELGKWGRVETFGGRLVENLCQSVARDCLAELLLSLKEKGMTVTMSVHDEVIIEVPAEEADQKLQQVLEIMATPIPWAPGLLLKGAGYTADFYFKG